MGVLKKKGIKIKKTSLLNGFLFSISPLLALPTIFAGIYNRNRFSLILLLIFTALITYQLVPNDTKDLYQFYRFYKNVKDIGLLEFLEILFSKPDFVVYTALFVFAKIGISGQLIFAVITFITLHLIFTVYEKIISNQAIQNKFYFIGVISILISIEHLALFSGMRNLLAVSITLYGFYIGIFEQKKWKGFAILIFAVFTHFGVSLFIPVYFFCIFKPLKHKTILIIYLISFFFLFLTKKYLYEIAIMLPVPEGLDHKIKFYLQGKDFIEKGNMGSIAASVSYHIRVSWIYFAHLYIFLTYKRKSSYKNFVILLMCLLNVFSVTPDIQLRLTYLVELSFIFLLFYEYRYRYNKSIIVIFFIVLIPSFIVNLMINRDYFIESLFNSNLLTLIGILLKKVELIFLW